MHIRAPAGLRPISGPLLAVTLLFFAVTPARAQSLAPLQLYWSESRTDNFTTATPAGRQSATGAGYALAGVEGRIYTTPIPGTIPLNSYWNDESKDNLTTASARTAAEAAARGYGFVRVEGHILQEQRAGTIPLKLFFSAERNDYFTTARETGARSAVDAGYRLVGVEGYVFADSSSNAMGAAAGRAAGAALPPGAAAGRVIGGSAPRPPAATPPPVPTRRTSPWSAWRREEGVEYRYSWSWNPQASAYVEAIFQIRNRANTRWQGAVRSVDCVRGVLFASKDVTVGPNQIREVRFRTPNCGTAKDASFRPNITRSYIY